VGGVGVSGGNGEQDTQVGRRDRGFLASLRVETEEKNHSGRGCRVAEGCAARPENASVRSYATPENGSRTAAKPATP